MVAAAVTLYIRMRFFTTGSQPVNSASSSQRKGERERKREIASGCRKPGERKGAMQKKKRDKCPIEIDTVAGIHRSRIRTMIGDPRFTRCNRLLLYVAEREKGFFVRNEHAKDGGEK